MVKMLSTVIEICSTSGRERRAVSSNLRACRADAVEGIYCVQRPTETGTSLSRDIASKMSVEMPPPLLAQKIFLRAHRHTLHLKNAASQKAPLRDGRDSISEGGGHAPM
jgi:hypothetical protein